MACGEGCGDIQYALRRGGNTSNDDSLRMRGMHRHGLVQAVAVKTALPPSVENLNRPYVLDIDEVSMLESILFDKIEIIYEIARIHMSHYIWERNTSTSALFGCGQVIACGKFLQQPPVTVPDPCF